MWRVWNVRPPRGLNACHLWHQLRCLFILFSYFAAFFYFAVLHCSLCLLATFDSVSGMICHVDVCLLHR